MAFFSRLAIAFWAASILSSGMIWIQLDHSIVVQRLQVAVVAHSVLISDNVPRTEAVSAQWYSANGLTFELDRLLNELSRSAANPVKQIRTELGMVIVRIQRRLVQQTHGPDKASETPRARAARIAAEAAKTYATSPRRAH